jgi:hypothetical protein
MNIEERSAFVLTAAKGLFVNGQSTEQTVAAAARLADALDLRSKLLARWSEVALQAIATGLLCGLALFRASLPAEPTVRVVPLWQDVIAAGVAVAAYSIFFSTPLTMLPWPVAVGALAHALRWFVIAGLGFGAAGGAFVACLTVGLI